MPDSISFPRNPDYGNGIFRRRICLDGQPGKVIAELEDCCHGFRCTVYHDGSKVTDIQAEAIRIPLTTCSGAIDPIKALIGLPLTSSMMAIHRQFSPRANCTHLYDLTILAIAHCQRGNALRQYDIAVEDERDESATASIQRDGETILSWKTSQWTIQSPTVLINKPLHKGFSFWAIEHYNGDDREAAFALQKGYFVAQARIYDMDKLAGAPAASQTSMLGVCYSYSPEVVEQAFRTVDTTRDFTDTAEQLLKFQ